MTCDRCGASTNGTGPLRHRVTCDESVAVGRAADVTWPGGKTFENLGDAPQTFYSPSELNRYLRTHNLEPMVRHQPVPGTDRSPHTTSWSAVSQATLDGAKAMLERVGRASGKDERPTLIESFSVTVTEERGTVTAPRGTFGVFG